MKRPKILTVQETAEELPISRRDSRSTSCFELLKENISGNQS